jgi:signal transduction histidine kinase
VSGHRWGAQTSAVLAGQATDDHAAAPSAEALACLVTLAERLATLTDLEAVLEAVADCATAMLAPAACAIDLFSEAGDLAVSLTRGLDAACADWWQQASCGARAAPVAATPLLPDWPPALQDVAPPVALRLPLALPERPAVGALTLFAADAEAARRWPVHLLHSLSLQAAAAVTSSRVRLRDIQAVYTVAQSITGRIDLAQLAEAVLQSVATLFDAAGGALILAESQGAGATNPHVIARAGGGVGVETAAALLAWYAERAAPLVLADLAPLLAGDAARRGLGLAAPLLLDRKLFGVLVLTYATARAFRQSDLWLLSAIASQVTMALRNAQLYLWSEELAIAEERSRIAREIHDGLAQSLAHKIVKLDLCQRLIGRDEERLRQELEAIKASVRADIQDVRHSILALRPLDLEHHGLTEAVQAYINQFSHDTGITIATRIAPLDGIVPKGQTALFRLVQEALNNIRKHAQATQASVVIDVDAAGEICLGITDNGRGFDVAAALSRQPGQTGIGLKGMIERTLAAGGTIEIDSAPGQGTRIEIRLPGQ